MGKELAKLNTAIHTAHVRQWSFHLPCYSKIYDIKEKQQETPTTVYILSFSMHRYEVWIASKGGMKTIKPGLRPERRSHPSSQSQDWYVYI